MMHCSAFKLNFIAICFIAMYWNYVLQNNMLNCNAFNLHCIAICCIETHWNYIAEQYDALKNSLQRNMLHYNALWNYIAEQYVALKIHRREIYCIAMNWETLLQSNLLPCNALKLHCSAICCLATHWNYIAVQYVAL